MIVRVLMLVGGMLGGASASQFPEFSQQYTQRLGGAVDALTQVVVDFDASASAAGLSRNAALAQMRGTPFLDSRRRDMSRTFQRHDALRADLQRLAGAGPFMRAYHAAHMTDRDVARAALAAYQPAVPINMAGAIFAGTGFVVGWMAVWAAVMLLLSPFRGRPHRLAPR